MLECPNCGSEVRQLVIPDQGKLGCVKCRERKPRRYNVNLGQTYVRDGKTRLTVGKSLEIEARVISLDDGKTVINKYTGKETQR